MSLCSLHHTSQWLTFNVTFFYITVGVVYWLYFFLYLIAFTTTFNLRTGLHFTSINISLIAAQVACIVKGSDHFIDYPFIEYLLTYIN